MPNKSRSPIGPLLAQRHDAILDEWVTEVAKVWWQRYPTLVSHDELRSEAGQILNEVADLFAADSGTTLPDIRQNSPLAVRAIELSASRAKLGFKPADTALYVVTLKNVLMRHVIVHLHSQPEELTACLTALNHVLDRLALLTFDSYVEVRERVISQQSVSLMELSSPAVLLWSQVVLLPLVGVIDTVRARQFMENLLEAISRYEARVSIIDVTGVPVFDTGVARHIMKVIDAANLLGSSIVMTGLSPEGAQTLTKLNLNFVNVTSRSSLRAGVAEAMRMIGCRIVATGSGS